MMIHDYKDKLHSGYLYYCSMMIQLNHGERTSDLP